MHCASNMGRLPVPAGRGGGARGEIVNLRNIRAIAGKEVYHLIRDFRSLLLPGLRGSAPAHSPFRLCVSLDVEHIETVVVDGEQTDLSRDSSGSSAQALDLRIDAHLPNTGAVNRC